MAFKMKNKSMAKMVKAAGDSRVAMKMKEAPMKMKKSPMEKELVGKQNNLPPELKAKIEAAPAKMRNRKGAMDTEAPLKMRQDGKGKPGVKRRDKDPMKVNKIEKSYKTRKTRGEQENPNRGRGKGYIPRDKNPMKPGDLTEKEKQERKARELKDTYKPNKDKGPKGKGLKPFDPSTMKMKRKTQVDGEQVTASKASGGMFMKKPMKMKKK